MLAAQAIIDNPVLVYSDPAINPRHQIFMAVLAKSFLKRRSHPDFMFHGNPYCHLDVFVRKQDPTGLQKVLSKSFSSFADNHVHDVLLACTDFHGLCPNNPNMRVHDTLDILVRSTVDML